jgi:hypothetical protein
VIIGETPEIDKGPEARIGVEKKVFEYLDCHMRLDTDSLFSYIFRLPTYKV